MAKKTTARAAEQSDFGTPELKQHHKIITEQSDDNIKRARNITQTPLDWYKSYDYITDEQWHAGNRIFCYFKWAGIQLSTVTDFTRVSQKSKPRDFSDRQIAARQRLYHALDRLENEGRQLVLHVCCYGEWAYSHGLPRKYANARLRSALQELAEFFNKRQKTNIGGHDAI